MNHSMINSAVTMHSLQQKLDVIANNMSNLNTVGYKRREATFEDILTNMKQQPKGFQREGRLSPLGLNQGWGAKLSTVRVDLAQGTLNPTGVTTDFAIEGSGMFQLQVASSGGGTSTAYTRDGSFQLSPIPGDTANMMLTTKEGHPVLNNQDQPILIPQGQKFAVDERGNVSAYRSEFPNDGATPVGQLKLVRVIRPQYLQQVGDNLYTLPADVQNANGEVLQNGNAPGSALQEPIKVRQGFLEQSNVNMADEMTELMTMQRAFQLSSKALQSADMMMNLTNTLRG